MNRFQFIGNLGRDAELRSLDSGAQTISFPVAITEKWKDRNGEVKEQTTWASCTMWKQAGQSTAILTYLKKGQKVLIEGKPSARAYTNKDGQVMASLEVRVDNLELIGGAPQQQAQPQQQGQQRFPQAHAGGGVDRIMQQSAQHQQQVANNAQDFDDDLPF